MFIDLDIVDFLLCEGSSVDVGDIVCGYSLDIGCIDE